MDDTKRLLGMWARETAEFEPEIVEQCFRSLLRSNPRNPFRPSVEDIVNRCLWTRRDWGDRIQDYYLSGKGTAPPAWCSSIMRETLAAQLGQWCRSDKPGAGASRDRWSSLSEREFVGWCVARRIGLRISEWPSDLLAQFGVPVGPEFARIQAAVDAEKERREREWREQKAHEEATARERERLLGLREAARRAALARPDIKAAFEAKWAAWQCNPRSAEAEDAQAAFEDLYRPALAEELQARGLTGEQL